MALAIVATLFGSPFVAGLAQQVGLPSADWLPETAQYRLHIWDTVRQRIAERPMFGWGFDASPDLPKRDDQPFRPGAKINPSHHTNGCRERLGENVQVGTTSDRE